MICRETSHLKDECSWSKGWHKDYRLAHWNRSGSFSNKGAKDRVPEVSCSEGKALAETLVPYEDLTTSKIRFINSFEKGFFQEKSVQRVLLL